MPDGKEVYVMSDSVFEFLKSFYESQGSLTRPGFYTMSLRQSLLCAELFMAGRTEIFAEVDKATWSIWEAKSSDKNFGTRLISTEEYDALMSLYNDDKISEIVNYPDDYQEKLYRLHKSYLHFISYESRRSKANSKISNKKTREKVFEKNGWKCCLCGSTEKLSIDHIVSVASGGSNEIENLQTLCVPCNSKKGSN